MPFARKIRTVALLATIALVAGVTALVEPASAAGTGSITGTVTLPGGATGTVTVSAYATPVPDVPNPTPAATATAPGGGAYAISGLGTGSYVVAFTYGGPENVAGEFAGDTRSQAAAQAVAVTDGSATTGIDATLETGGTITGVASGPGGPLASVCVRAGFSGNPTALEKAVAAGDTSDHTTLGDGAFSIPAGIGSYYLLGRPCTTTTPATAPIYSGGALNSWEASSIDVTSGSAPVANLTLPADITISGTVTGPGALPLDGICVDAFDGSDFRIQAGTPVWGTTAADGTYTLTGVHAGDVKVNFYSCDGQNVINQFWNAKDSEATATPITVVAGDVKTGIDAALTAGGKIQGSFTPDTTVPGSACTVAAVKPDNSVSQTIGVSVAGHLEDFELYGLRTGSFRLHLVCSHDPGDGSTVTDLEKWYDGVDAAGDATPVAVTEGATSVVVFHADAPPATSTTSSSTTSSSTTSSSTTSSSTTTEAPTTTIAPTTTTTAPPVVNPQPEPQKPQLTEAQQAQLTAFYKFVMWVRFIEFCKAVLASWAKAAKAKKATHRR